MVHLWLLSNKNSDCIHRCPKSIGFATPGSSCNNRVFAKCTFAPVLRVRIGGTFLAFKSGAWKYDLCGAVFPVSLLLRLWWFPCLLGLFCLPGLACAFVCLGCTLANPLHETGSCPWWCFAGADAFHDVREDLGVKKTIGGIVLDEREGSLETPSSSELVSININIGF